MAILSGSKFFIQKDLPEVLYEDLSNKILALGGRVVDKVPRVGFVLVDFGTPEEERLTTCWKVDDRPDRYFVQYTYVDACEANGALLKQIFIHQNEPIKFHIHPSIANVNTRLELTNTILNSGGDPLTASGEDARVILADHNTEVFQSLVKTYQSIPGKYVESYLWVKRCIAEGMVQYTPTVYKNPGGRRPGDERMQFTNVDEEHLCEWIAAKIPYKETGGRTGNRIYQQLCEMVHHPDYAWVVRHTWQSWRERYKKNSARLDNRIAVLVELKKPLIGEQGQYGYVRAPEEKPKGGKRKRTLSISDDESVDEPSQTLAGEDSPIKKRSNMLENEDTSNWDIRVGNATPPAWARKGTREDPGPRKKPRVGATMTDFKDIAITFRFTSEEVEEYYVSVGKDLERTRRRFRKMRHVLSQLSDDGE